MTMDNNKVTVRIKIRRYDSSENPEIIEKAIELDSNLEYALLKRQIQKVCDVDPDEEKVVIKLRRDDEVLIPFSFLLSSNNTNQYFYIDICKINYANKLTTTLLQDAYIDSVCEKLRSMESRIVKAEMLLPQLEWRRQAHMEDTVSNLSSRVSFLNRRLDELLPAEWKSKMPQSIA